MIIAIGSDHAGYRLKEHLISFLNTAKIALKDFGVQSEESSDYPDIAANVSKAVQSGEFTCGILICGTGIGMSIVANKYKGIRAALCAEPFSARFAREHNNANIITLGSRVTGPGLAEAIVEAYLAAEFEGGRHNRRLDKIVCIEKS
jgi:ribose 5-phosphate isomerase B